MADAAHDAAHTAVAPAVGAAKAAGGAPPEAGGELDGCAAAAPPFGLLELARAHNAGPDGAAESDLFVVVLPAEPAADLVLRHLGFEGLGAFMATCSEARRAVSRAARSCKWRDCEREREREGGAAEARVKPARVAEWAERFPNARALAVSAKRMTPALAVSIATAAGGMRRLETLSLRKCWIDTEGAKALADAMTAARDVSGLRLVKLDLYYNGIGAEGASALAKALPACAQLATLYVGGNGIGAEGEAVLRAAASAVGPRLKLVL